ncbi:hypothetical protein FACS1894217_11890 [Clostridia bacterium]|nr:hypothetical protein FACS1894217_11890 [Clostridia bacterium]
MTSPRAKDDSIIEYIQLFAKLNEFERARILGRMQERVEIRAERIRAVRKRDSA